MASRHNTLTAPATRITPAVETFAQLLRHHRLACGLSQEELAERAGLSRRGVSDLERGLKQTPRQDTLARLADALQLDARQRAELAATIRGARAVRLARGALIPLGTRPMPPLIGRERELEGFDRYLASSDASLLLLTGEPGIGKSRLLAEMSLRAHVAGWQVLSGGCSRRSVQEPHAPFPDALGRHLASRSTAQLHSDMRGAAWLVRLLPELAERGVVLAPQWNLPPEQERRLMFAAVGRVLENLAGPAGTLLVLDDMQWAGVDALDLLAALIRQQHEHEHERPLRIVAAYRDTDVRPGDPFARFLAEVACEDQTTHWQLGPLREIEARELLAYLLSGFSAGDAGLGERIVRRSGGVPLFLVSCARGLRAGALDGEHGTGEAIPWDLRQNIRQRVAALPEQAQAVLGVAATAGRGTSLALLVAATGQAVEDVLRALEATDQARLLLATGAQTYRFAHDVIREVVEADLGPVRRRTLHRVVAEAMEQHAHGEQGCAIADLVYHFTEAGEGARALPYVLLAAEQAEHAHAFAQAERQYELAADLARQIGDRAREAEAERSLTRVLAQHARYDDTQGAGGAGRLAPKAI